MLARLPGRVRAGAAIFVGLVLAGVVDAGASRGASRGSDPVSCSGPTFEGVLNVHTTADVLAVKRSGDALTFTGDFSFSVSCGTVLTVNTVNIDLGNGFSPTVGFLLDGGPFAPGKAPEMTGASEIEFNIANPGQNGRIEVLGNDDADGFTFGQRRNPVTFVDEPLINMNAFA